jgi:hypothetical protein
MDKNNNDTSGGLKMIQTAELVAKEAGITRRSVMS